MALSLTKKEAVEYVADVFEATGLGAPFKVLLHDAVTVVEVSATGEMESYKIPAVPQLLAVVLISRLLHTRKLSGPDIKFARKVLGLKQSELARSLDFSPEHISRCENGATPLSPQGDKLLRVFAIKTALKLPDMPKGDDRTKLEDAVDEIFHSMKVSAAHSADDEIALHFRRVRSAAEDGKILSDCAGSWSANGREQAA